MQHTHHKEVNMTSTSRMNKTVGALVAVLVTFAVLGTVAASAARQILPGRNHTAVRLLVGHVPVVASSKRALPAGNRLTGPSVTSAMTFNGHIAQSCWADSVTQFECGWHGILVIVQTTLKRGPFTVRATSIRHDVVRLNVRLSWR